MTTLPPLKNCFYYGFPSSVNGTFSVAGAIDVFNDYDQVVFGAGLEQNSHPDHNLTLQIISGLVPNTEVYGYIDATLSLNDIQDKIDKWYAMSVTGIFLDRFGYDFGLTREKQREIVWCVHEKGTGNLKAFVNAFNVDDAFDPAVDATYNPNGLETRLGANDFYLAESFCIINGNFDDNDLDNNNIKDWQDKAAKMINYRTTYGTKLAAVTTTNSDPFDQAKADYGYYAAVLNGFDSWGWGEENFSATSAQLPFRTRKDIIGTNFTGSVVINGDVYTRQTNVGIKLDTNNHTVDTILN